MATIEGRGASKRRSHVLYKPDRDFSVRPVREREREREREKTPRTVKTLRAKEQKEREREKTVQLTPPASGMNDISGLTKPSLFAII